MLTQVKVESLDIAVHIQVMGSTPPSFKNSDICVKIYYENIPNYSEDMNSAFNVVRRLNAFDNVMPIFIKELMSLSKLTLTENEDMFDVMASIFTQVTPKNICLASLKAVGYDIPAYIKI